MDVCTGEVTIRAACSAERAQLVTRPPRPFRTGTLSSRHKDHQPSVVPGRVVEFHQPPSPITASGRAPWSCLGRGGDPIQARPGPVRRSPSCASARLMADDPVTEAERNQVARGDSAPDPPARGPRHRHGRCQQRAFGRTTHYSTCGRCGHSPQGWRCIIYRTGDHPIGHTGTAERPANGQITARRPAVRCGRRFDGDHGCGYPDLGIMRCRCPGGGGQLESSGAVCWDRAVVLAGSSGLPDAGSGCGLLADVAPRGGGECVGLDAAGGEVAPGARPDQGGQGGDRDGHDGKRVVAQGRQLFGARVVAVLAG